MPLWMLASGDVACQSNGTGRGTSTCDQSAYWNRAPHALLGRPKNIIVENESAIDLTNIQSDQKERRIKLDGERGVEDEVCCCCG